MAYLFQRGRTYYLKFYVGGKQKELSLRTDVLQIAKEKQRQFESSQARGDENPLATRTALPQFLQAYVSHIRAFKTAKSAQTEIYYLREAFGPICDALCSTARVLSPATRKRRPQSLQDGRRKLPVIEAACLEEITTAQLSAFVDFKVRDQGLKPKTANHYRSILRRLFNWAAQSQGVRLRNNVNAASKVRPYKEAAPEIRFLTLSQIEEQLHALRFRPQLQTMVAVLIYSGLRREELLWLTLDDIDLRPITGGHGVIRVRAKPIAGNSWQPKTKVNRAVPSSDALRQYLNRFSAPATTAPNTSESFRGWHFPSPTGALWDTDNFSTALRHVNQKAGLDWTCLDYRHTFGSLLAQRGISHYKVSTLMGNSPDICRRHYAALTTDVMCADVEFQRKS